jgi:DNA-binding NarL/FixJ family response regulator
MHRARRSGKKEGQEGTLMAETWVSLPELAEIVGTDAAGFLCAARGGVSFYVPKEPDPRHVLARIVGERALIALSAEFGGQYITVPNGRKPDPRKPEVLRALERGEGHAAIALKCGVTERYVRALAAAVPKVRQLTLPVLIDM